MEGVGAAASVVAIAAAGIQVSLKLIAFTNQVQTASRRIEDVGTDVSVTAGTLQELGEYMNMPGKRSIIIFYPHQVQAIKSSSERCARIFEELKKMLSKASHQLRDRYNATSKDSVTPQKIKLSKLECIKWPFLQPSMDSLRSELRDAKAILTLMLQVVNLRYAQKTASLNQDEQEDLKRTIIAMKRQQLASNYCTNKGYPAGGIPVADSDDSVPATSSSTPEVTLEAWSVKPNTWSGEAEKHFLTTQLPVSQEKITKQLKKSPQSYDNLTSVLDDLSALERDAIWEGVLAARRHSKANILSITVKSWTGTHTLFGQVKSRKFALVVERRTEVPKPSPFPVPERLDSPSLSSSPLPSPQRRRRRHRPHGSVEHQSRGEIPNFERERPVREREEQDCPEKVSPKERKAGKGIGSSKRRMQPDVEDRAASGAATEATDDDLIKSLLAQYTDYEPKEPSAQDGAVTPPPAYKEATIFPKREPRPY